MNKLIDFWSVPHFLFGVVTALFGTVFGFPFWSMFFMTLAIAIAWEIFEARFKLGEVSWNIASDIVLPLIAFPATFLLADRPEVSAEHRLLVFIIAFSLYAYTNVISWRARLDGDPDFKS